jgi:hypothetical protein
MKILIKVAQLLTVVFFFTSPIVAGNIIKNRPTYDAVYRTARVADAYHFLLLTKNGTYYYLHTNKTNSLTAKELRSSNILSILDKKQSWGQAFPSKGKFIQKNGKFYTQRYWDSIKVISPKTIKYLNKTFYLQ